MPPKKDKKKGKQKQDDYWDTDFQQDAAAITASTSTADLEDLPETAKSTTPEAAVTADPAMDDLAEEFGGLMAAIKKSKGKKGGKKQQRMDMVDANVELEAMEVDTTTSAAAQNGEVDRDNEDGEEEQEAGEFRVK